MKKNLMISIWFTLVTTVMFGMLYPARGHRPGTSVVSTTAPMGSSFKAAEKSSGSRMIGQAFVGPGYFHSRPSAAGTGYDADVQQRLQFRAHQQNADRPR